MAAHKTVLAGLTLRYTLHNADTLNDQETIEEVAVVAAEPAVAVVAVMVLATVQVVYNLLMPLFKYFFDIAKC